MPLINPDQKETQKFDPRVDNTKIEAKSSFISKFFLILSCFLILPAVYIIVKRNNFKRLQMRINESSSGIDIQLKKRRDTLIKLVNAVKGSMKFEKETLTQITQLRSNKTQNSQELMNITDKLASAINVNVEAYPNLRSTELVQRLMRDSADIELEIAASRRLYNAYVNQFNTNIFIWPSSVIATWLKLYKFPLYVASVEDRKDVDISF